MNKQTTRPTSSTEKRGSLKERKKHTHTHTHVHVHVHTYRHTSVLTVSIRSCLSFSVSSGPSWRPARAALELWLGEQTSEAKFVAREITQADLEMTLAPDNKLKLEL